MEKMKEEHLTLRGVIIHIKSSSIHGFTLFLVQAIAFISLPCNIYLVSRLVSSWCLYAVYTLIIVKTLSRVYLWFSTNQKLPDRVFSRFVGLFMLMVSCRLYLVSSTTLTLRGLIIVDHRSSPHEFWLLTNFFA